MTPDRWRRISAIYNVAIARSVADRMAYVSAACGGDEGLRRNVESLLAQGESFLGASVALPAGSRLGPYELVSMLGAGGMGVVYRARDTRLQRDVALKVLPEALALDPERVARFKREAQLLASLNHPHIAAIHGLEESNGLHALVLELVEGVTLADRIARRPIPLDEALPIARQIAEALEVAHEQGIIHRDLKPANIKVRDDGTVKVLDFGLAKLIETGDAGRTGEATVAAVSMSPTITSPAMRTGVGVLLGTAAYMSPEQARGRPADKRSDIWAFGCVVYEMLTGKPTFEAAETVSDAVASILKNEPDWHALPAETPPHIRTLLRRCLQKDLQKRLPHIGIARIETEEALQTTDGSLSASATVDTAALAHGGPRRSRVAWALAAISGVAALALVVPAFRYLRAPAAVSSPLVLEVTTPPTDDPVSLALSPDGERLAFVARDDTGVNVLWVRNFSDGIARPLPTTVGAMYPFWAPNNREIGFFADRKLKRIDTTGGGSDVVADAPSARGGAWNRDDVIVFAPDTARGLFRVNARGGSVTSVVQPVAGQNSGPRWPQFLPDGRRFIFFLAQAADRTGVYLAALDGGALERVLESPAGAIYVAPGFLLTSKQDSLLAIPFDPARGRVTGDPVRIAEGVGTDSALGWSALSASSTARLAYRRGAVAQRRQFVWVDRAGKDRGTVGPPDDIAAPGGPELSPDERRLALHRSSEANGNVDTWFFDLARGVRSRLTSNAGADINPLWSPDGQRIVFGSNRTGVYDLYETSAAGTDEEKVILRTPVEKRPLSWSADGKYVLYLTRTSNDGRDLWALPMTGGAPPFPAVQTPFDESEGQISPDGAWVAYASTESGALEVYVQSFPQPGERIRVSNAGGSQVRWAPDGRELYYIDTDGRLMAVKLIHRDGERGLQASTPEALFTTRLAYGANVTGSKPQYAVSRDGRFLLNVRVDEARSLPITIVLNAAALAK